MVNPLNLTNNFDSTNYQTEFENGTAIGMPPINFSTRKNVPLTNINSVNGYNPSDNFARRYNKNSAPSGLLTEAFLRSRLSFNPVFFHNEAAIKYQNISKIFTSSDDIKINMLRVA